MLYAHENRSRFSLRTPPRFIIPAAIFFFAFVLSCEFGVIAQDSDLEKSVNKKSTGTKTSAPKKSNNKPAPKTSGNTSASPPVAKSTSRARNKVSKTARKTASEMISFTFKTPEPKQEVWLGEMKLGVSNDESELVKSIKAGVYLVTLKRSDGEVLLKSQLVSVAADRPSIELKSEDAGDANDAGGNKGDENVQQNLEVSENILAILEKYADPNSTGSISIDDWRYVLSQAQTNQIKGFTQVQIEAQKWFASGQIELFKGNYVDALTAFQSAKTFMAGSAYPDYAIGETYSANNQINDALRFYTSAVAIQPTFALAHGKLGDVYAKLNKPKEAAASYTTALQHGYSSAAIRFALAKEQMKNKKWDDAAAQLEFVVKEAPSGEVYLTLGDLYREEKRAISSYEAYRRATELLPKSSIAYARLGEVLLEEKEYVRARAAFEKALELDSEGKAINVGQIRKYLRESEQKLK